MKAIVVKLLIVPVTLLIAVIARRVIALMPFVSAARNGYVVDCCGSYCFHSTSIFYLSYFNFQKFY
jgi:hypothetical protein